MSTHSVLGVEMPDGSIDGCYVHFDGDTMAPRIEDYIENNTTTSLAVLIKKAQKSGGIRSFHCPKEEFFRSRTSSSLSAEKYTEFLDDSDGYVIDKDTFFDDHMCTFAWYLVNYETGEIKRTDKY